MTPHAVLPDVRRTVPEVSDYDRQDHLTVAEQLSRVLYRHGAGRAALAALADLPWATEAQKLAAVQQYRTMTAANARTGWSAP